MSIAFLPEKFPSDDISDGMYLYRSLGSFWTQVFQDKDVLKGYTIAMADELAQSQYDLLEVINQYSVKDIQLFHKTKWKPLTIQKSKYNKAPFVFEAGGAVFGRQPTTDEFYSNQLFRFGYPKESGNDIYSYTPDFPLKKFGAIANRLIAPSFLMVPGSDVIIQRDTLYFNTDLFDNEYIPRSKVLNDQGEVITFLDLDGHVQEDELIILWMYHAEEDMEELYKNFGTLFDIYLPTSESYKALLQNVINLFVEGPTITALNSAYSALAGSPSVIEKTEIVEDVYADSVRRYVITDKSVYRISLEQELATYITIGAVLHNGQPLTRGVILIDTVISSNWWQYELNSEKLAIASHVFVSDPASQLFFSNSVELLAYTGTELNFPVTGRAEDVAAFQTHINQPANKSALLDKLGMTEGSPSALAINPIDFVFQNIFKNNTLLLKLEFYSDAQLKLFFDLLPVIQRYLPSHVYIITYIHLHQENDELNNLNSSFTIPGFGDTIFAADGSVPATGARPYLGAGDTQYYKDYENRVFCISVGPYRGALPLHHNNNLDVFRINDPDYASVGLSTSDSHTLVTGTGDDILVTLPSTGADPQITDGKVFTEIPLSVQPVGEDSPRLPSTREIPTLLLIDF